jgi:hypothetical protein
MARTRIKDDLLKRFDSPDIANLELSPLIVRHPEKIGRRPCCKLTAAEMGTRMFGPKS